MYVGERVGVVLHLQLGHCERRGVAVCVACQLCDDSWSLTCTCCLYSGIYIHTHVHAPHTCWYSFTPLSPLTLPSNSNIHSPCALLMHWPQCFSTGHGASLLATVLLYCPRHSLYCLQRSLYWSQHSLYCLWHSLFWP